MLAAETIQPLGIGRFGTCLPPLRSFNLSPNIVRLKRRQSQGLNKRRQRRRQLFHVAPRREPSREMLDDSRAEALELALAKRNGNYSGLECARSRPPEIGRLPDLE